MMRSKNTTNRVIKMAIYISFILLLFIGMKTDVYAQLTGTVTAGSANVRKEASTSSAVLAGLKNGDEVSIVKEVTDSDGTLWYEIHVDADTKGYVAASLITKDGDSAPVTNVTPTSGSTSTTSTTTNTSSGDYIDSQDQWKSATISSSSVRVRKDASTSSDILATVTKGVVLTVTGSKTGSDGYEWHQVSFKVDGEDYLGFIRSDLITFENVSSEGETTVSGTLDPNASDDEESAEETVAEETEVEAPTEEPTKTTEVEYTVIATDETVEVPNGYIEVPYATDSGETKVWKNGDFYIVYATSSDGSEGWYRYDNVSGVYQRYVENESISALDSDNTSNNNLIIYILAGALAIMFIVCLFLIVRLSDVKTDLKYRDDELEDEDDEEDWQYENDAENEMESDVLTEDRNKAKREIRRDREEDLKLARELEDVLEQELVREQRVKSKTESKPKYEEDPEAYLKPDEEESWDDEFDFIDLD